MPEDLLLNVPLLRRRVPNLTSAARSVGLRPATVSDLCTGKIPIGRAEVRTLAALASLAGCTLDELLVKTGAAGMVETGIKVIDLFAPLVRGGIAGAISRPGLGQVVLLQELVRTLKSHRGFETVLWLPEEERRFTDALAADAGMTVSTLDEAAALLGSSGVEHDIFVVTDREKVLSGELTTIRERAREAGARPVTFALYDLTGQTPDIEGAPFGPLETVWRFEQHLATRVLYPAIDPIPSTSTLLDGAQIEASHFATVANARLVLRRYQELRLLVSMRSADAIPEPDRSVYRAGERLEAFMTQPFFSAEAHTKRPGAWVPLSEALDGVRRILDGAVDGVPVEKLMFLGSLPRDLK
ncbi:MAG: hypothetical protein FJ319_00230 [SAR202 cluster bacterium]|nr:hypothetical protein [SAR202 cluster bacterium]